ncbi:SsrA-binding protein SmpB [Thermoproteota archaeon]
MAKTDKHYLAKNKKAFHDFEVLETIEAGLALVGCEVKSIRQGQVSLKGSFARMLDDELYLMSCHITPYTQSSQYSPDPTRDRKLLVHKRELKRLEGKVKEKGLTLIPLSMYLSGNRVKVALGLCRSKKLYDKRKTAAKKDVQREMERGMKARF